MYFYFYLQMFINVIMYGYKRIQQLRNSEAS